METTVIQTFKNFKEIENRIREIIKAKKFTEEEKEAVKREKARYPALTNIQLLTLYYIKNTPQLLLMQGFTGKTRKDARQYILACQQWDMANRYDPISWDKRKQIANALLDGMEPFIGKNEEDANKYLTRYYKYLQEQKIK